VAGPARRAAPWLAVSIAALFGLSLLPPVQARAKGWAVLLEGIGADPPRPFASAVTRRTVALDGVQGDLYRPPDDAPAIVLVPGAARLGKDDPRIVRLARAIARGSRVVFVPQMALANRRFIEDDLQSLVRAVVALDESAFTTGDVSLLGISYGGSFAMVAAADPRLEGRLAQVAVFGAYFDLVGVVQAATTGVSIVEGRRIPWDLPPEAQAILEEAAPDLVPAASREDLGRALESRDPSGLAPGDRALYELLVNRDPDRTRELAGRLSGQAGAIMERFSPAAVADRIRAPVIAMHSMDDPAVPFAEAIRLRRAMPEARMVVVRGFRHVDFTSAGGASRAIGDLLRAWRFATWLLAAQE
jgi:pimeloyl-ACP methyl ester carboxylesterase